MDTHLVKITDLVKDYAKIIDELREENRALRQVLSDIAVNIEKYKN